MLNQRVDWVAWADHTSKHQRVYTTEETRSRGKAKVLNQRVAIAHVMQSMTRADYQGVITPIDQIVRATTGVTIGSQRLRRLCLPVTRSHPPAVGLASRIATCSLCRNSCMTNQMQDFATSRKSPPIFGRGARVQEKPGRSAVFAVLPWRKGTAGLENKAFPCCSHILSQSMVRIVAEFRVTVAVCRRSKSGSPSCQSQRHGRGSPGQRLSLKPLLDYVYPDSGHRLKLKASTPDSLKAVVL